MALVGHQQQQKDTPADRTDAGGENGDVVQLVAIQQHASLWRQASAVLRHERRQALAKATDLALRRLGVVVNEGRFVSDHQVTTFSLLCGLLGKHARRVSPRFPDHGELACVVAAELEQGL